MPATQRELSAQMIAQLRLLDSSVSAEIGTPERKILDTVGQALYDSQIDLDALASALDIDAKYGAGLDRFLNIFGFSRQKGTFATGFVTFSRITPSTSDIRIPAGATIEAPNQNGPLVEASKVRFTSLYDVILPAGALSIIAPIRCNILGEIGNVATGRITNIVGSTIYGITDVVNETATSGGKDAESDEEFKVRFKNTVFRNLAGTKDQYLALAISTAFTSKANIVGPQSFYREYIQVPPVDDNTAYDVDGDLSDEIGNGSVGEYTTARSTIPYAKYIYTNSISPFVSNGETGFATLFYRDGTDFEFNYPPRNVGDTYRIDDAFPPPSWGSDAVEIDIDERPNVTFNNIYTGEDGSVEAVRPGDVVLLEYGYMSSASRNSVDLNITNAVDVFIDGGNNTLASTVTIRPTDATAFVDDSASKFYYENFRRVGESEKRPIIGNVLMQLFWQPVLDVPDQIIVDTDTYFKGVHYWPVVDISSLGGTVRARNGIEWSTTVNAKSDSDTLGDPSLYTGRIITDDTSDPVGGQPVEVVDYEYDKNIVDLQAIYNGSKQITTDILAHKAKTRYFKLDVTTMYSPGASIIDTNVRARDALDQYLQSLYFGSTIQLSDLLQVIHSVSGIDNVRWTSDTPNSPDLVRIYECDINGKPLLSVSTDLIRPGNGSTAEIQGLYITGIPESGGFTVKYGVNSSADIEYDASVATINTRIGAISGIGSLTVTEDTRSNVGVRYPMRSFKVTWSGTGAKDQLTIHPAGALDVISGGPYVINNDFFLRDDELARLPTDIYTSTDGVLDTVAGLIIRPRAQNTWVRSQ